MLDFIPINYYTAIYYYFLLGIIFLTYLRSMSTEITEKKSIGANRYLGFFAFVVTILYMGLRPISGYYFGDMATYAESFELYQNGEVNMFKEDVVFDFFMQLCAKIISVQLFFVVCAFLYVLPLWSACRKWFKE